MPLKPSDFPAEVQVAFFVFDMLSDVWEGMSGTYMGKDWSGAELIFSIYEIEDRRIILYLAKMYERAVVLSRMQEAEQKRKAEERKQKASSGGKKYTHNVTG